jgi:hypothetical protein
MGDRSLKIKKTCPCRIMLAFFIILTVAAALIVFFKR